jgi:hypothetical protein
MLAPDVDSNSGILPIQNPDHTHSTNGALYVFDIMQMINDPLGVGGFNITNGTIRNLPTCDVMYVVNAIGNVPVNSGYRGWELFIQNYQLPVSPEDIPLR